MRGRVASFADHKIYNVYLVFGRFSAELGPETRSNGSGSKNGAERTQNKPQRPIIRPFRDHFLVRTHNPGIQAAHLARLPDVFFSNSWSHKSHSLSEQPPLAFKPAPIWQVSRSGCLPMPRRSRSRPTLRHRATRSGH